MSAPTPEPTGLSESERRVLDDLAAGENAGDPGFVLRMNHPERHDGSLAGGGFPGEAGSDERLPDDARADQVSAAVARGRRRDRLVQVSVLGAIVALLLPLAWTIALVLTAALVVVPTILVVRALRDGGLEPPSPRPDTPAPPDRS